MIIIIIEKKKVRMCVKVTQASNSERLDNILKCYRLPNLQNTRKSGLLRNHVMRIFHAIKPIFLMFHESHPEKADWSCLHAMHTFHAITQIILLFHESRPVKRANRIITPTCGGTLLKTKARISCSVKQFYPKWV